MAQHHPGLVEDEKGWRAGERTLEAAEQGEQHGHEIALAKRHQVLHLEDGEETLVHAIASGIEKAAQSAVEGVRGERGANAFILHRGHKIGEAPVGWGVAQEQQRAVDFVLLARARRRSRLQTVGAFDPVARKSEIAFGFKGCKRRKADAALAAKIVMAAANPIGQSQKRTALVEGRDLGAGIAQELRRDHGKERRFSSARRPENQRVADIGDMEVEAERAWRPRRLQRGAAANFAETEDWG